MQTIVALSLLVPILVGGLLAATSSFEHRTIAAGVAIAAAAAAAVLCAIALSHTGERLLVVWWGDWRPRGGVAFGIDFAVDPLGGGLALFVAVLAVPALLLAGRLIVASSQLFLAVGLLFVAAMIGYSLTGDLFDLFVFFELMSVSAYVLVGYEVRQRAPLEGALTFAVTNTVGSILLLFGIALLYGKTGALNLAQLGRVLHDVGPTASVCVAFAFISVGLLVKAAVVPFHFWTADAYAVAPTPVLILLGGVFSEIGLYGFARVYWTVFEPALGGHHDLVRAVFVALGLLTGLLGGAMALAQNHLKRMLAFVTISQIGLFLIGIALLSADGLAGTAIFLVGDGFAKATLFTCVGVIQHRCHQVREQYLHGRARELWPLGILFAVAALVVADLPPFGSFVGRSLIEDAALKEHAYRWLPPFIALVSALAGAPLLRAAVRVFLGRGRPAPEDPRLPSSESENGEDTADEGSGSPRRVSPALWLPAVALVLASFGWGLVPGLVHAATAAAARFTDPAGYAAAVLGGPLPAPPPVPEAHWPGVTGFLYSGASVLVALALAGAGLVERRVPAAVARPFQAIRALHSGRPGDYVAWTGAGAAVLAAVFALAAR